jgi:D-glycero-D-manno-heptose 1,7-bisphosphate phosphatase
MRILVHGPSLETDSRMAVSAAALALRGHEVFWLGRREGALAMVPAIETAPSGIAIARLHADVVLGGPQPFAVAVPGWLARAPCMLLAVDAASLARWGRRARWAWSTLHASGLLEAREADDARRVVSESDHDQLGLWSDEAPAAAPDTTHLDTEILERACERALARHRSRAPRTAVFVDRDGTLIVERGYLAEGAELELLPGVPRALHNLRAAGFPVIVISNQAGVGRGLFPLARVYEVMARLRRELRAHGVELDGIYFCPHRPDEGCACRKPGTELLERAAEDQQLSLRRSTMVGDKLIDSEAGRRAGGSGVLVRTGYGREEERRAMELPTSERPDFIAEDLPAAAAWILAREDAAEGA